MVRALPTCLRPAPPTRRLEEPKLNTLGWSSPGPGLELSAKARSERTKAVNRG
jgi:hypothetical protein